ncbi:Nitroreductase [Nonomuraea solani]|uniref:Nitroreductase n=1 Tax=Nonomuraea solani TaxID=1144553 RepID=A0A1H6F1G2_9ACTN|nr:nitroreductase family protein [Nonomuraea solani]SEH03998.1 Nitroreductase [Nonomuraea solani]
MSIRSPKQVLDAVVEAGRWAPSVHNTQPWTFAVAGEEISLRADADRKLSVGDAAGRALLISCGADLFTMRTVMRCEGYEPVVRILPDPDRPGLLATVEPGEQVKADEPTWVLGGEIERRRTHRAGFADVPVPEQLIESLVKAAMSEGAKLTPVRSPDAVSVLAALTQVAQGVQVQDQRFNLEVIRWARPPGSTRTDGVPAEGYPREAALTEPHFPQRHYSWRHGWGRAGDQNETVTGVVAVLTTRGDNREEWIAAGQALQHALLYASAHGVSAAFHTQALEIDLLREFVRLELCAGEYPQMIMRLGVTFDAKDVPRRPVSDVLE